MVRFCHCVTRFDGCVLCFHRDVTRFPAYMLCHGFHHDVTRFDGYVLCFHHDVTRFDGYV